MQSALDHPTVQILLGEITGFEDHYLDLVDIYGDDLGCDIVLMELADVVADLLSSRRDDAMLEQCLEALEQVARLPEEGDDLVAAFFLAELPPSATDRIHPLLGERTAALLDELGGRRYMRGDESPRPRHLRAQPLSLAGSASSTASMHRLRNWATSPSVRVWSSAQNRNR